MQTATITFQLHQLPKEVDIALECCKVRLYIPSPQLCFRCQRYGHVNCTCKTRHEVCANCGSTEHVGSKGNPCPVSSKCVNCQGDHPSYSRACLLWKIERKVQEKKKRKKKTQVASFPKARRIKSHKRRNSYMSLSFFAIGEDADRHIEPLMSLSEHHSPV